MKVIAAAELVQLDEFEQRAGQLPRMVRLNEDTFNWWQNTLGRLENMQDAFHTLSGPSQQFHANFFQQIAIIENREKILRQAVSHMGFLVIAACESAARDAAREV